MIARPVCDATKAADVNVHTGVLTGCDITRPCAPRRQPTWRFCQGHLAGDSPDIQRYHRAYAAGWYDVTTWSSEVDACLPAGAAFFSFSFLRLEVKMPPARPRDTVQVFGSSPNLLRSTARCHRPGFARFISSTTTLVVASPMLACGPRPPSNGFCLSLLPHAVMFKGALQELQCVSTSSHHEGWGRG